MPLSLWWGLHTMSCDTFATQLQHTKHCTLFLPFLSPCSLSSKRYFQSSPPAITIRVWQTGVVYKMGKLTKKTYLRETSTRRKTFFFFTVIIFRFCPRKLLLSAVFSRHVEETVNPFFLPQSDRISSSRSKEERTLEPVQRKTIFVPCRKRSMDLLDLSQL